MPRRPNKRKYFNAKPDQQRKRLRREELSEGMTGFLISTSKGNEQRSVVEAYDLLNEYMDIEMAKLEAEGSVKTEQTDECAVKKEEIESGDECTVKKEEAVSTDEFAVKKEETVSADECAVKKEETESTDEFAVKKEETESTNKFAVKKEETESTGDLTAYRTSAGLEERKARFKAVEAGCNNLIFISSAVIDPTKFAHSILTDLHEHRKARARYMQRLLPVVATCRADIDTVRKTGGKALTRYFTGNGNPSYLILFKTRNTSLTLTRDMIIALFGDIVRKLNPACRANLDDPDYAISVDVIKSICCISVIKDYGKLKKYNVHVEEEDQEDRVKLTGDKPKKTQDEPSGFRRHEATKKLEPVVKTETAASTAGTASSD